MPGFRAQPRSLVIPVLVVLLAAHTLLVRADDGWQDGRATYYGNDGGATIHQGSCMFGQLDANAGTGWDIAALSDSNPDFDQCCGRCYEVKCRPASFSDGYGQHMDRNGACKDQSKTVVVRITDACPCYYPGNAYSNKRWCCGDMQHMDLSYVAFEKLADLNLGVMGIQYRRVDCPQGTPSTSDWQRDKRNRKGVSGTY